MKIYDDPRYADRYTVLIEELEDGLWTALALSDDLLVVTSCKIKEGPHLGEEIGFEDLPEEVQTYIEENADEDIL